MNINHLLKKIAFILGSIGLGLAAYFGLARPYQLQRGATAEEVNRRMPGDEILANPKYLATRAITIDATPEKIWPWLMQMGYGRAGFYGYDIFENLGNPRGIRSAESILAEFQNFKVGDDVPISPAGGLKFYAIEPGQYVVWRGDVSWGGYTWALYPVDGNHTRLVSRARFNHTWSKPGQLALDLLTEFSEHLAIPKILQGVKGRVEGRVEPMAQANLEFGIYLSSALVYLGAIVMTLLLPLTWRRGVAEIAAGAAWLVTWYAPGSPWTGLPLELAVIIGMFKAFQQAKPPVRLNPSK